MIRITLWETINHLLQHPAEIPFSWVLLTVAAAAMWLLAYSLLKEAADRKKRYGIGLQKRVKPQGPKQRWDGYEDLM